MENSARGLLGGNANRLRLILAIAFYLVMFSLFSYWSYVNARNRAMQEADERLHIGALALIDILPEDYHDRAIDADAIPIEEDIQLAERITAFVLSAGYCYAYTLIKGDGGLYFVAGDLIEDPETDRGTFYYYPYVDADECFTLAFDSAIPTYSTVTDQWGTVRTIMYPTRSPGGVPYLACVDYDITYVSGLLRGNLIQSVLFALFFLALSVPLILLYRSLQQSHLRVLTRTNEQLRVSAERLELALCGAELGTWDWNISAGKIVYNERWAEMLGCTLAELDPHVSLWERLVHPDDLPEVMAALQAHLDGKTTAYETEHRVRHKSGAWVWVLDKGRVTERDADGQPLRACGTHLDVTERRQMEGELRREQALTEKVINALPDTFFLYEPATGKALRWNQAFTKISGYTSEEIAARQAPDSYFSPEDLARVALFIEGIGEPGQSTIQLQLICKNGRTIPTEYTASLVSDPAGTAKYLILIGRDITDRKRVEAETLHLQEQLRQKQKMEAIGTLAGGIAHDFNNILFAILGHADLAADNVPDANPAHESIREIVTAGKRAAELVKQILTFARQADQRRGPLQVSSIVKEVTRMLRATLPTTIEISQRVDAVDSTIIADPTEIHQVILNLCGNAGQAMETRGGTLGIFLNEVLVTGVAALRLPELQPGAYVVLRVSDTGPGVPPEIQERIFEPFFTTKSTGQGTGMGLAVVHGIVKSLGGCVTLASEPGQGAVFSVYLPLAGDAPELPVVETHGIPLGNERVMVVDDEPGLARMIKYMLERLGYEVEVYSDSQQALVAFQEAPERFDVVITDQTMPVLTGADLARQMLEQVPDLPIILCSGFSQTQPDEFAADLGLAAFVSKPVSMRDLATKLRHVLDDY